MLFDFVASQGMATPGESKSETPAPATVSAQHDQLPASVGVMSNQETVAKAAESSESAVAVDTSEAPLSSEQNGEMSPASEDEKEDVKEEEKMEMEEKVEVREEVKEEVRHCIHNLNFQIYIYDFIVVMG